MHTVGISKKEIRDWKFYLKHINITFLVLSVFSLSIFSVYENLTRIMFSPNKLDIVTEDLHDVALYFQYYDKDVRDFLLTVESIIDDYLEGKNIFETKQKELDDVLYFVKDNKDYLLKVGFNKYQRLADIMIELIDYKDEIYELAGKHGEQNYLVLLQNTAEKRPNGGFFGSFALVSIKHGFIEELEIIDAYYPKRLNPDVRVPVAPWAQKVLGTDTIGFISSNKFGFTATDGHNIKTLFDLSFNDPQGYAKKRDVIEPELFKKTFNKEVQGVIFLRSDFLTFLLPDLKKKLYEWQFINASIDLIRGENLPDKKEIYKKEITQFFEEKKFEFVKNLIKNFDEVLSYHYINIHLENTSKELKEFIKKNNLTTNYDSNKIYARDNNHSYNKIDSHVKKEIRILDKNGTIVTSSNNDVIAIDGLPRGQEYTMEISYTLHVSQKYVDFIYGLQEKYGVEIGSREKGILGVEPVKNYRTGEQKWRATKATLHFPKEATIKKTEGDMSQLQYFESPFSLGVYFESVIVNTNDTTNTITIHFSL